MFDRTFNVFVWKGVNLDEGRYVEEFKYVGEWRVIGEVGMEDFCTKMFNYACDGYNVEYSIMNKEIL